MMCGLQIGLLIYGIVLMRKKELTFNGQVAPQPTPFFIGLALVMQLPVLVLISFAVGVHEGIEAAKTGVTEFDVAEYQAKYWWIDVAVPTAALAVAGVLLAFGLRDPGEVPPEGPDDGFLGVGRLDAGHTDGQDDHRPRYDDEGGGRRGKAGDAPMPWNFKS